MEKSTNSSTAKPFYNHVHALRAIATVCIVAIHAWGGQVSFARSPLALENAHILSAIINTLFRSSTVFFALISGLLFSLILQKRGYKAFFHGKLVNVVVPYALATVFFTLYGWREEKGKFLFLDGGPEDFITTVGWNLYSGDAMYHLWYIPVLILIFCLTPVISFLVENAKTRWIAVALIIAPVFFSRTWPAFSISTVIYFLGAYTAGVFVGRYYEASMAWLGQHLQWLWGVVVVTSVGVLVLYLYDAPRVFGISIQETCVYIQKATFFGALLVVLEARSKSIPQWVGWLATYSFTIYFFHASLLILFAKIQYLLIGTPVYFSLMVVAGFAYLIATLIIITLLGMAIKRLFPSHSKWLIGA